MHFEIEQSDVAMLLLVGRPEPVCLDREAPGGLGDKAKRSGLAGFDRYGEVVAVEMQLRCLIALEYKLDGLSTGGAQGTLRRIDLALLDGDSKPPWLRGLRDSLNKNVGDEQVRRRQ